MDATFTIIKTKEQPSLEEAQEFVGGLVELVTTPQGQLLVNEEGLILGLPQNPTASKVAGVPICGNALLLSGDAKWD